jgi:8-oxo-dGTP pyrophosphatase MutT (NUDIX family)
MLDHHIQRSIVYTLAFSPSLRFSELQPDDIDSKLFTYHLKKVMAAGLVEKYDDGTYALTPEGRRVGKSILRRDRFMDQAYSILLLAIRRPHDGAWLLYTRGTHPLIGLTGFMQATPVPSDDIAATAARTCLEKTGLTATFSVVSSGFFRVFEGEALESFTHFTLLVAGDASGELSENDEFGTYEWVVQPDFTSTSMLPTAHTLSQLTLERSPAFIEKTFQLV